MAGSRSMLITGLPLNSQSNLLMILRGMILPASSLRNPVSIGCGISVLITITSPFLASPGTRRRGLSAIMVSCSCAASAAAAADRHLHQLLPGIELADTGLGDDEDILGGIEADAGDDLGTARHRRETDPRHTRPRIAVGDDQDLAHVVISIHRTVDHDR